MAFKVTERAGRPAGVKGQCFYCRQKVGAEHAGDCVLINKNVMIKAEIIYDYEVPSHWGKDETEFALNQGTWCQQGFLDHIQDLIARSGGGCICGMIQFTYLGDESDSFLDES